MWLSKVLCVFYLIAVCAAQDPQAAPTPQPTTPYEPPVPVLLNGKSSLEAFPTEKVELTCSVPDSSDWTFTWYTSSGEKVDPGPNFSFSEDRSLLTVTVQNGATYSCEGLHKTRNVPTRRSNLLHLKVSENIPKPTVTRSANFNPMFPGEKITFTCVLQEFSGWEYLWYHNTKELPVGGRTHEVAVSQSAGGKYHCRAKRGKFASYSAESEAVSLVVSEPPTPSLRLLTPWPDVFENEEVEFSCEVSDFDWTYTWYKDQKKLEEDSVLNLDEGEGMLNITSARRKDQGAYGCRAHLESRGVNSGLSNITRLTVYENLPKPTIKKDPAFSQMYVGETVNFTCSVSVASGWEYLWYKDENQLVDSGEAVISVSLGSSDGGNYWCKARRGGITTTGQSEIIQLDVLETPTPLLKPVTKWVDVFPTEAVKFHCGIQGGPGWKYTWYKDSEQLRAGDAVSFDTDGATLSISSASAGHEGQYECKGNLQDRPVSSRSSTQRALTVYGKKPTLTVRQDPEYKVMYPGESVSFVCHLDVIGNAPEWEYMWYKDDQPLAESLKNFTRTLTGTADVGSYKCQTKRGSGEVFTTDSSQPVMLEVKEKTPKPSIILQPDVGQLYIGEPASFECKLEPSSEWNYYWSKDGESLPTTSGRFEIDAVSLPHTGTYECKAERSKTKFLTEHSDKRTLIISEIPVPSLTRVTPWPDVFPTESVTLSCGMQLNGSIWEYVWYKDSAEVRKDEIVSFGRDGTNLAIARASVLHQGNYSCSGKLKSRSVRSNGSSPLALHVYDKKPVVTLMQDPVHSLMHTEDSVSFGCHVNVSSGWDYQWYKDGKLTVTSGDRHNISSAVTANTGSYECQVKRGEKTILSSERSRAVRLEIKERPRASVILKTGWSEVFSTDSLALECEVLDGENKWNYTWYKEEQEIELVTSERHIVTPQNDPDQSGYTCRGIRSGRPAYSQRSSLFKTKNLLLKRRLLLSISGIIFFGIIAIFLGCIVCRVLRKPVEKDEKPEEANLFLSMAQLKDLTDDPCPLVEYITDASLNATLKEVEENGTICSETTPLPISSQEENGVMADGQDKAENNGGLTSFQH